MRGRTERPRRGGAVVEGADVSTSLIRTLDHLAAILRRIGLGRLTRAARRALEGVLQEGIAVEVDGVRIRGGIRDRSFLYRLREGTFEPATVRVMSQAITPGAIVVDVGAYLGYYTVLASRLTGAAGKIYAIEPDPGSFRWLERNIRQNGCRNVVAIRKALSAHAGTASLYRSARDPSTSSLFPRREWVETVPVEAVKPDAILDTDTVDVVKIDVEGAEPLVLAGMAGLCARSPDPVLFVELNPTALREAGSSPLDLQATLHRLGFDAIEPLDEERGADGELQLCNLYCRRKQVPGR